MKNDPTYDRAAIDANPVWALAFTLSEIMNDGAPIGWARYIGPAELLFGFWDIKPKGDVQWSAYFEYQSSDRMVHATTIQFLASDAREAAKGAIAWWGNRQKNIPEMFTDVLAISIHQFTVTRPDKTGYIASGISIAKQEWKIDFPFKLDDWPKLIKIGGK